MSAQITILYPKKEGSTFNLEYYLQTHMPLVQKHWGPEGLKSYTVTELDERFPYSISCILTFESVEKLKAAGETEAAKIIMGDVPNFSSEQPLFVGGKIVGSG